LNRCKAASYAAYYCMLIVAALLVAGRVLAASTDNSLYNLRIMAENDPVAAYREVKQLRAELTDSTTDSTQIPLLNLQARLEFLLADSVQAEQHSNQALMLATQRSDAIGQADALLNLAKIVLGQGRLELSTELTFRSAALLSKMDDPALTAEIMFWQVLAYRRRGREQEAVTMALQAMEIAAQSENLLALAFAYRGLSLSYEQSYHNTESLAYSQLMLRTAEQIPSRLFEAYSLQDLATRAGTSTAFSVAETLMQQAIGLYRQLHTPFSLSIGLLSQARMYTDQQRYAQSLDALTEAISIYQQYPAALGYWYALIARSNVYVQLQEFDKAEKDARLALATAQQMDDIMFHSQNLDLLATIAAAKSDYAAAYTLRVQSSELINSHKLQMAQHNVSEAVSGYEQERQQRYIDSLNQQNLQQSQQIKQKQLQQSWLVTLLVGSLLLLLLTVYFLRRLGQVNLQLRGLAARLETAREEERKQIARDLHDDMGQYLTALRLDISGMDVLCADQSPVVAQRIRALKALVDKAISIMRSIVTSIRPAPLEMGVIFALEWLAEEFSNTSGISCQLDISPDVPELVSDKYMTAVFRVVQESLTNIVKHAEATHVIIRLSVSYRKFFLSIADNGKGFNLNEIKQNCYGLTGMRERAYMLGGELTLRSRVNDGTEIGLTFRIAEDEVIND